MKNTIPSRANSLFYQILVKKIESTERIFNAESTPIEIGRIRFFNECERRDSNPHALRHGILSPARLPIPPLSRIDHARRRSTSCFVVFAMIQSDPARSPAVRQNRAAIVPLRHDLNQIHTR